MSRGRPETTCVFVFLCPCLVKGATTITAGVRDLVIDDAN